MTDEVVSVAFWRGYVTGRFYAHPVDRDVAVAQSPSFRVARLPWEKRIALDRNPAAASALDALQKALIEAGWQQVSVGSGSCWFQLSFRRPLRSGFLTPLPRSAVDLAEAPVGEPANGHAAGAIAGQIIAVLEEGPLASNELCRRVGRSSRVVRVARTELELAGLVRKAAPPAGRSKRATYWQLSL